jgi:eukaryotic-like serine/threonine-protein kinase
MEPLKEEDLTGRTVDHYAIVALIAAGGQGCVYRGRDMRLHRDVAIKVGRVATQAARRTLMEEARVLSLLNHPHVAGIYDFVSKRDRGFIVMEFVPGATLRDILAGGPLPSSEVARLGADIARGLAAAHAANVVHGDIKPSNLKITSSGQLKILDFGVARMMPAGALVSDPPRTPSTPSVVGTVPYMAPEQLRGYDTDGRTDVFSVGSVLYEMVTGHRAFPHHDLGRLVEAIQYDDPARPTMVNPLVPLAIERVIMRALRKDPAARQQSAIELAESLEALMPHGRRSGRAAAVRTAAGRRAPSQLRVADRAAMAATRLSASSAYTAPSWTAAPDRAAP